MKSRSAPAYPGARVRILLIEDDPSTTEYVVQGFTELGHVCDAMADGASGLGQALQSDYDVLVIDRMLPGRDGLTIVKALRASDVHTPVLFLTALDGVDDRVHGLEAGADDYLIKPFAFSELAARVNALARRPPVSNERTTIDVGELHIDLLSRQVTRAGQTLDLNAKEFRLLEVLARNAGRAMTRTMLLERVWDFHFDPKTSVVETHMSRLRAKLDKPFERPMIETLRGMGYTLRAS